MAIPTLPTVPNDPYAGAPLAESALAQQAITPGAPLLPQYQDVYLNRNQPAPEPAVVEPVEGEDPYAGATVVEPEADPYAGAAPVTAVYGYDMEKLSATPVEVLKKDKTEFNPVDFYAKNTDALLRDPEALKKVEAVFEERDKERMTPFGLVKAAVTAPLNAVLHPIETAKKTVGVAKAGAEFVGTLLSGAKQVVATGAEVAGNLAEGDLPGAAKGISEAIAAADLAQQRWVTIVTDKVGPSFGVIPRGKTARERLAFDADFKRAELKAAEGNGQLASDLGASQDELRSLGVNLDPGAIERLSVIEDPLFLVPVGSAIGVTGRAGKFLLGKATSPATAEAFAKGINSAMERAAAWPIAKTGAAVEKAGALAEKAPKLLKGGVAQGATGGMIASAMHGNFIPLATALAAPTALKYGGKAVAAVGRGVQAAAPAVGRVAAETAKGAGEGAVLSMPLFLGSNEEEREGLLGMIAGSGFLRGSLAATGVAKGLAERGERLAGRSVQNKLAAKIFEAVDQGPVKDSKAYGTDTALDAAHQQHSATLSRGEQSLLSTAREFFRDAGVEIYGLDKNTFVANVPNVAGASAAEGFFLSRGERLNPDGTRSPVLQVLLNKDTNGLGHELYHAFKSLDPQGATALEAHITKTWTPEEQAWLSDSYNSAINGGKPKSQWTVHLNEKQILEEAAAEVFGRVVNATDLSGVRPSIVKRASTFASTILEKMGHPLAGKALPQGPGVSALGVRPGTAEVKVSQDFLTDITRRVKEGSLGVPTPGAPLEVGAGPAAISRRPSAPQPSAPPKAAEAPATPKPATPAPLPEAAAEVPVPAAPAAPTAENIRVTPKEQADFAAERSKVTNADQALAAAVKSGDPAQVTHVTAINDSMANGHAVEVVHKGVIREGGPTPEKPVGRGERRAEQAEAYVAEAMGAVPDSVRELHQKLFFGTRWLKAGKQLTARSLDKALANVKNAADMSAGKVTLPYEVDAAGKLTEAGWAEVVQDLKDYWSNQDRGFRGDGKALTPETRTRDVGQSIPPEDPRGPAALISTERTDFLNLVQGLNIPETVRGQKKGVIPGNVKGQLLAEAQGKKPAKPAGFTEADVQAKTYKPIEGVGVRSIAEVNPLRNDLRAKGAPVEKLIEVTENINVKNIESVTPRPDVTGRGGSTDITRAGFSARLAERFPVKEPQSSFSPAADFEKSLDPVKMAAIRTKGGQIFTGAFHGEAYLNLADAVGRGEFKEKLPEGFKSLTDLLDSVMGGEKFDFIEDGFVTESGKYLNRKEAFEHGKKIGQLKAGYGEATRKGQFEKEGVLESDEFNRGKSFSPATEKGKEFAKQGYEFTFDVDELGGRLVHVNKDGQRVGLVESVPEGDKKAEVSMAFVTPEERGKGLAEAMYRELLTKLKADGIELVSGLAVSPEPIAIRKKIFGSFESLATKKSGESVGPVSVEEALAGLTKLRKGLFPPFPAVDVVNRITEESKFSISREKEKEVAQGLFDRGLLAHEPVGRLTKSPVTGALWISPDGDLFQAGSMGNGHESWAMDYIVGGLTDKLTSPLGILPGARNVLGTALAKRKGWLPSWVDRTSSADLGIYIDGKPNAKQRAALEDFAFDSKLAVLNRSNDKVAISSTEEFLERRNYGKGKFSISASPEVKSSLDKVLAGEQAGETFTLNGRLFNPGDRKLDVVTLASENFPPDKITPEAIQAFVDKYPNLARNPDVVAGVFKLDNGLVSADLNVVVDQAKRKESLAFAKENNQEAIFDLVKGEVINTGGTGESRLKSPKDVAVAAALLSGEFSGGPPVRRKEPKTGPVKQFLGSAKELFQDLSEDVTESAKDFFEEIADFGPTIKGREADLQKELAAAMEARYPKLSEVPEPTLTQKSVEDVDWNEVRRKIQDLPEEEYRAIFGEQPRVTVEGLAESLMLDPEKAPNSYPAEERSVLRQVFQMGREQLQDRGESPTSFSVRRKEPKRDKQGRPLTEEGLVDYERLYKEKVAAERAAEAKEAKAKPSKKYLVPAAQKPPKDKPTGWILPDGEYVPINTEFHQDWLGENRERINKDFGTNFGEFVFTEDRQQALNKGFVRVRDRGGDLIVELHKDFFKGKTKNAVKELLAEHAGELNRVSVSLLSDEGQVVDSVSARLFDSKNPRDAALSMLDKLNPTAGVSKKGPSAIQRARAMGGEESFSPALAGSEPSRASREKAAKAWKELGTESPYFQKWFGKSEVVDPYAPDQPLVVYHGTTHEFTEFTKERSNIENDFGQGFYFSSEPQEVSKNYAGEGPDLTSRIERRAEELYNQDGELTTEGARAQAVKEVKGTHEGAVKPAYLAIKRPFRVGDKVSGRGETVLEMNERGTGTLDKFLANLERNANRYDNTKAAEGVAEIQEKANYESIGAKELVDAIRDSESFNDANDERGDFATTEMIRQTIEDSGFDGIIDETVSDKFPHMISQGDTIHYIAFKPEQIKSTTGNVGTFRKTNPDIRFSAKLPTDKEVSDALFVNKRPYVGAHRDLKPGTPVGLRIDIPAFTQHGVYVITVHEKASGGSVGKRIGHDSVATVDNPTFFSKESGAIKIKEGAPKFPIATVEGEFNPAREVPKAGGEWTEVGFNPVKHSYFYEKGTEKPVVGGEQAVSAGNSVFVKNAEFGDKKDFAFSAAPKKVERETGKGGQKFFPQGTPEFNAYAENKIAKSKEFPEAFPLEFRKDENGNYLAQWDGDVLPAAKPYNLLKSDLAEKSGSKEKFLDALGTKLVKEYREAKKNPEIAVGEHWYSIFREKVGKVLGDDTKLFAELLGATSPQQAVGPNFKDALGAYNQFKRGAYDAMIEKYREGKKKFFDGDLAEFTEATGKKGKKADYAAFMSWWQNKHNLLPTKADGKKFGMNSRAVMKVLDRSWLEGVQGPKTPNFTGNLSGTTFKATIDVWAMRALSRLAGEDSGKPWRVQAANESGVSDPDFYFGQDAFQKAADEIGIKADALQAILWFAEKDRWEKNGWTGAAGKAKSDYNTLLDRTTKTPEGFLDLADIAPDEVKPKAKKGAAKVAAQLELSDIKGK